jgi:alpha-amylase
MKKYFVTLATLYVLIGCNSNNTNKITNSLKNNMDSTTIFKKAEWIKSTNVYEVNLRQYTAEGTFNAFAKELPRLKDMGVETLWFMPITPIAQKNKKGSMGSYYACSDYTSINSEFGNLSDFKNLVKQAHTMGFKVIIDWVANHTGWDHVWTKTNPDYFLKDSATHDFKTASGMDDIIELNYANPALRTAMIDAMKYWVTECDIDGYRCDLAFWVELDFWMQARAEIEKTKTLFWLAELDPIDHPDYYNAFDAAYTWSWMHKTEEFYKQKLPLNTLDSIVKKYDAVCKNDHIPLWFTSNHDENSWNGTEYEKYGNLAKILAVHSFTFNGMPMIYSGQELPNNKRLKFFDKDVIDWNGKYEMVEFYKTLLALKKNNKALLAAEKNVTTFILQTTANENIMAYLRKNENSEVAVLLNCSNQKIKFEVSDSHLSGSYTNVFSKVQNDFSQNKFFEMQPWEFLVYEK